MDESLETIYWRDEILQILFWFRGEGLGESIAAGELVPFLAAEEEAIAGRLESMTEGGYLARDGGPGDRYRLTEMGLREGGRRFADEFAGLTGQAHGECSDPNCSCHTLGPQACTTHTEHSP